MLNGNGVSRWRVAGFARFLWRRFNEVDVLQAAGSLTFTTLLALVPILTVLLVVVTVFPLFGDMVNAFMLFLNRTIVPSGVSAVVDYLNEFKLQAGRLTTFGVGIMVVTVLMMVNTVEQTFNQIWRVQQRRSWWVRLPMYLVLVVLVPAVVGVSVSLSTNLLFFGAAQSPAWFSGSLKVVHQLLLGMLALTLVFRVTPSCYVPMRHAVLGAGLTAALLEVAKWGFGVYLRHFHSYELVYGAFAIVPIFLIWLHMLWSIVLGGALFTACCNYWQGNAFLRTHAAHTVLDDVLALLLLLARENRVLTLRDFRQRLNVGYDRAELLLLRLDNLGYVARRAGGWVLCRAPDEIGLGDLFRAFVFDVDNSVCADEGLDGLMRGCMAGLRGSLGDVLRGQGEKRDKAA